MSKDDEYRANADDCRQMAAKALRDEDRARWLQIAAGWLSLVRGQARNPDLDAFEAMVADLPPSRLRSGASTDRREQLFGSRIGGPVPARIYSP